MDNSIRNEEFKSFMAKLNNNANNIIIEATVPTGMEKLALIEIKNKFNLNNDLEIFTLHGRIFFSTIIENFNAVCYT